VCVCVCVCPRSYSRCGVRNVLNLFEYHRRRECGVIFLPPTLFHSNHHYYFLIFLIHSFIHSFIHYLPSSCVSSFILILLFPSIFILFFYSCISILHLPFTVVHIILLFLSPLIPSHSTPLFSLFFFFLSPHTQTYFLLYFFVPIFVTHLSVNVFIQLIHIPFRLRVDTAERGRCERSGSL